MELQVGERLPGSGPPRQPGGYLVTEVVTETPWYGLYVGKKIFYNFDFSSKRVRETDDKEWLDVYLRTIRYPFLEDADYVAQRRALARSEVRFVLGNRGSNLWPEPIDLLEIANTRDAFSFPQKTGEREPVVVFARSHGQILSDWQQNALPVASILGVLAELLEFIDQAHQEGLLLHGLGPASILVDRADRLHFVGTDMVLAREKVPISDSAGVIPARQSFADAAWTKLFPAERFPRGFAAPECFDGGGLADRQGDLYAWGTLAFFLITGTIPWQIALEQNRPWAWFQDDHFAALERILRELPPAYIANWLDQLGLGDKAMAQPWPKGMVSLFRRLLSPDPRHRPDSVAQLRAWLLSSPPPLPVQSEEKPFSAIPLVRKEKVATKASVSPAETLKKQVQCSECSASVPGENLEIHLLVAHHIYQFRGLRHKPATLRDTVLDALCSSRSDIRAWKILEALARDRYGPKADHRLVAWLCQRFRKAPRTERLGVIETVAEAMTAGGSTTRLLPVLLAPGSAASGKWLARCLALEGVARLPAPLEPKLLEAVQPYLSDRHCPRDSRQRALIGLLRTTGKKGQTALGLLSAFVHQTGKLRALEKLRDLEARIGKSSAMDTLYTQIENQVRMNCPRCAVQLPRAQMVPHLWENHRLMLDGLRVRDPWRVLDDWLVDYRLEKDQALLRRCYDLAKQLKGDKGRIHLQQLMLRHGIEDLPARTALTEQARQRQATLCPRCFHFIFVPDKPRLSPLTMGEEELRGHDYRLEFSERGPTPWLEIETPDEILYQGREPGRFLTRLGAMIFLVGPLVLAGFVILELMTGSRLPALAILGLALGSGLFLGSLVYFLWPRPRSARQRLVDAAWTLLVPHLIQEIEEGRGWNDDDANVQDDIVRPDTSPGAFLGRLALTSRGRGRPGLRAKLLTKCLQTVDKELGQDSFRAAVLAALTRLLAEDLLQTGEDPLPVLVDSIHECWKGALPMTFADYLLTNLASSFSPKGKGDGKSAGWTSGCWARLRVLLALNAFHVGLELNDLQDLGLAYPGLTVGLDLKDFDKLIGLRFLWSLTGSKPWERCGQADTVFELAGDPNPAETFLAQYPGLLLAVEGYPLYLTGKGLWCQHVCLKERPGKMEIVAASSPQGEPGYHLVLGRERLWFAEPPDDLLKNLERWLAYYFVEFLPGLHRFPALGWGKGMKNLAEKNAMNCSACGRPLIPCVGEVGIKMEN